MISLLPISEFSADATSPDSVRARGAPLDRGDATRRRHALLAPLLQVRRLQRHSRWVLESCGGPLQAPKTDLLVSGGGVLPGPKTDLLASGGGVLPGVGRPLVFWQDGYSFEILGDGCGNSLEKTLLDQTFYIETEPL
uniref:Uncharacterized protein n=1 Tax=Steinernema glaseri TaxID=37863 RepID=A0A1I7ZW76_9BILA